MWTLWCHLVTMATSQRVDTVVSVGYHGNITACGHCGISWLPWQHHSMWTLWCQLVTMATSQHVDTVVSVGYHGNITACGHSVVSDGYHGKVEILLQTPDGRRSPQLVAAGNPQMTTSLMYNGRHDYVDPQEQCAHMRPTHHDSLVAIHSNIKLNLRNL